MNLDDMKKNWQENNNQMADQHFAELAMDVTSRFARFESSVLWRDWIEATAAISVFIFFGVFLWFNSFPFIMTIGIAIIMLSMVEIIVVMFWTRHRDSPPPMDSSILEFSKAELARLDRQIGLLRKISWWYSTPILVGCTVMVFGVMTMFPELPLYMSIGFFTAFCLCFLWAGLIIQRGNKRAVDTHLIPLRNHIAATLHALSAREGGDEIGSG